MHDNNAVKRISTGRIPDFLVPNNFPAEQPMCICYFRSILLGTKGFDVPRLSEKLDRLDTAKTFEPLEPVRETDIQV